MGLLVCSLCVPVEGYLGSSLWIPSRVTEEHFFLGGGGIPSQESLLELLISRTLGYATELLTPLAGA